MNRKEDKGLGSGSGGYSSGDLYLRGFTLLEVLVSAAILSFLIAGIFGVLNIGNMTYNTDLCLLDLQQSARQALYWMAKELRESSTDDITITVIDDNDDKITFDTPNEIGIQYYRDLSDVNGDNIKEQIIREYPKGTRRILGNNISGLQFSLNNNLLEIRLTANSVALGRSLSIPLRTKVRLRNE